MTAYDIIQLIISILSLISTIAISIILYCLDRKREKDQAKINEALRVKELEWQAEMFILNNGDEIDFLPLCVFASSLNKTIKHRRNIYNNFNRCSDELQQIILEKQGIFIKNVPCTNWFDEYSQKLGDEIERLGFGWNVFYDHAKYVKECFQYYRKDTLPEIDETIEYPDYQISGSKMIPWGISHCHLAVYIHRYATYLYDIKRYSNPQKIHYIEPCNLIYEKALASDRTAYCYWMAMLMRNICSAMRELGMIESILKSPYSQITELTPTYYEDIYYCALLELYTTFGLSSNDDKHIG